MPEPVPELTKVATAGEIHRASEELEGAATLKPIKDELDVGPFEPEDQLLPAEVTSDEDPVAPCIPIWRTCKSPFGSWP